LVAVGAVEDKKPTVVLNVDWCVAVVIAGTIALESVDTGFEGVLWGDIPVRKYNKIKRGARNWAPLGLKAPQCGAFRGFETAV